MSKTGYLIAGLMAGAVLGSLGYALSSRADVTQDATKLAPQYYKTLLENRHVRVVDYRMPAGDKEPMHSHPKGVVVYYFTDAKMRVSSPSGKTTEAFSKAGDVVWRDPVTHAAQNIGNNEVHSLLIEPKESCQ